MSTHLAAPAEFALSLVAVPATSVAPGDVLELRCTVENHSAKALSGARLIWLVPPELHSAVDRSAELDRVASLARTTVVRRIGVPSNVPSGAELRCEALLLFDDGHVQRTQALTLDVCGRPRLNGPRSAITLEPTAEPDTFVLGATIVNDGTAPATGVRIDLPLPAGTLAVDPVRALETCPQLEIGASFSVVTRIRVAVPTLRSICCAGASVTDQTGRVPLVQSQTLALAARFAAPQLTCTPYGRRLIVTACVENLGPGCAQDVDVALRWPDGYTCLPDTVQWNGAPILDSNQPDAYVAGTTHATAADLRVASIDAAQTCRLELELTPVADVLNGRISVHVVASDGAVVTETLLPPASALAEVRLRLAQAPRESAESGLTFGIELCNATRSDVAVELSASSEQAVFSHAERQPPVACLAVSIEAGRIYPVSATLPAQATASQSVILYARAPASRRLLGQLTVDLCQLARAPVSYPTNLPASIPEPSRSFEIETALEAWRTSWDSADLGLMRHLRGLAALAGFVPDDRTGNSMGLGPAVALAIDALGVAMRLKSDGPALSDVARPGVREALVAVSRRHSDTRVYADRLIACRSGSDLLCALSAVLALEAAAAPPQLGAYLRAFQELCGKLPETTPLAADVCGPANVAAEALASVLRARRACV